MMTRSERKPVNYSKAISWCNIFLSALIIILHTDIPSNISDYSFEIVQVWTEIKGCINVICDIAVPAFFIISAFLLYRKYNYKNYFGLLKTKIKTLVIPFLIWNIIAMLYHCILAIYKEERFVFDLVGFLNSSYNQPLWFIKTLFGFIVLSPVIYYVIKLSKCSIILYFVGVIANLIFDFGYTSILFWIPCYYLGAWLGVYLHSVIEKNYTVRNIFDLKIIVIIIAISIFVIGVISANTKYYYLYRMISGVTFLYYIWRVSWKTAPNNIIQCSFWAFCSHSLLLGISQEFAIKLCQILWGDFWGHMYLVYC